MAVSELPGSKFRGRYRDIVTDISTLKSMDISDVVVLITMAEFRKFRVPSLLSEYETNGFLVFHFPIEDGMIPEDVLDLVELLSKIRKRIGKHCVQCFQKYDVSMNVCMRGIYNSLGVFICNNIPGDRRIYFFLPREVRPEVKNNP